tara:strand:- start:722 stop:949 length:228 start_codon:yes stop_codon:yes gene_type:complete
MNKPINKKQMVDMDQVEQFFDEYDSWGSIGWLTEIVNGNIDLKLLRKAILFHSINDKEECQKLVDDMFIVKWWEK